MLVYGFIGNAFAVDGWMREAGLEFPELVAAFVEFAENRGPLGQEKIGVIGHQDCSFGSKYFLAGSPSQCAVQVLAL